MSINLGLFQIILERKTGEKTLFSEFMGPLVALLLALLVASVIIVLSGANPIFAYASMMEGAFGSFRSFSETMIKATPLLLAALGLTISYRTGLVSVGAEGQIVMGGLAATLAGLYFSALPGIILIPLLMIAGMLGGGLWGAIPGYLRAKLGVSEVINTIMLNYVAIFFVAYLLDKPLKEPPGYFPQSAMIAKQAWLPVLFEGTRFHLGVIVAIVALFVVYFLLWRSPLGYQMRAVGLSQTAAHTSGINVKKNLVMAMGLSGMFAGLAGMVEVSAIHHRLVNGFSSEYGFDAMAVALLGKLHPAGVVVAALFFGALRVGANMMQRTVQVPSSLVFVIQGLVILFVLMDVLIRQYNIRIVTQSAKEDVSNG